MDKNPHNQLEDISKKLRVRGHHKVTKEYSAGTPVQLSRVIIEQKTWWDWLQLVSLVIGAIAVPASILVGVWQFTAQQKASAQMQATQVAASAAQTLDQQRQAVLDTYLKDMSDLIFTDDLATSKPGSEVRAIAQAKTYTTVRNLDGNRKATLVQFLREAGLISLPQPIISLRGASLEGTIFGNADLSGAYLGGADLRGADLRGADLRGADLSNADLSNADLSNADLSGAHLSNADLSYAHLSNAILVYADLSYAHLSNADLSSADLTNAILSNADLSYAHLNGAILRNAHLSYAYLSNADLSYAYLTNADLSNATLSYATLIYADLSVAQLSGATLIYADLSGATLIYATLSNADLSNADLNGARNLTQPQLDEVHSCTKKNLPTGLTCNRNQ